MRPIRPLVALRIALVGALSLLAVGALGACSDEPRCGVAGKYHTCARRADGTLRCWGLGDTGQLGKGSSGSSPAPVEPVSF